LLEIVLSCFDLLVRELQSDFTSSQMFSVCGWREDLVATVVHVRSREAVDASRVVLIGMSLCGGLAVLTSLLQRLLAGLADNHAVNSGLHAFDGLLVLDIAGYLYVLSRQRES
jgi:hypothetical protein